MRFTVVMFCNEAVEQEGSRGWSVSSPFLLPLSLPPSVKKKPLEIAAGAYRVFIIVSSTPSAFPINPIE